MGAGAAPAHAGTAGSVAIASQDIYRGDQASEGDPVITFGLHHEEASGFFLGGTLVTALDEGKPRVASGSQYAGYAFTKGRTTIEIGLVHRTYRRAYSDEYEPDFTEGYIGVSRGSLTGRVFLSPSYVPGRFSVYTDIGAEIYARHGWSLAGHAGLRTTARSGPPVNTETTKLDLSLRVEKSVGRLSFGATVTDVITKNGREAPRVAVAAHFAF